MKINYLINKFFQRKKEVLKKKIWKFEKEYKKIHNPSNFKIKKIVFDTTNYHSELCEISLKFNSDKSPYNKDGHIGHRHAYTGIYHYLFKNIKNNNLNLCELGILLNEGAKLFREYFKNSKIYCFDFDKNFIEKAKKDNLKNVFYDFIDVRDKNAINNAFEKLNIKFDIIIDDSSHLFDDQIRIIEVAHNFMAKKSYLIIEDIFVEKKGYSELDYFNALDKNNTLSNYSDYYFIEAKHQNEWSSYFNNSKILVLEKN